MGDWWEVVGLAPGFLKVCKGLRLCLVSSGVGGPGEMEVGLILVGGHREG